MRTQIFYDPISETASATAAQNIIDVNNIDELYAKINDPANKNKTIVMARGTYRLSDKDSHGDKYPNDGRLELQQNMSLVGQTNHPELVIIDVTGLPPSSFLVPPSDMVRSAPIRTGNGNNSIEWLTVENTPGNSIRALIQTDIAGPHSCKIRVAHTILKGSSIGLCIINRYDEHNTRIVEAEIEDNEVMDNTTTPFMSGVTIQNSHGVSGATIRATLKRNTIHGNGSGIWAFNAPSGEENKIIVKSFDDRIEANGIGILLRAGSNTTAGTSFANRNLIELHANGTSLINNTGSPAPAFPFKLGGVFATAALLSSAAPVQSVNNNSLKVTFRDCLIQNNVGQFQINAYGAYSLNPAGIAGVNNSTEIILQGSSSQTSISTVPSDPFEPGGTNTIDVHS